MAAASDLEIWKHAALQFQELENRAALALALQELHIYNVKEVATEVFATNKTAATVTRYARGHLIRVFQSIGLFPLRRKAADAFHVRYQLLKRAMINSHRARLMLASAQAILDDLTLMFSVLERDKAVALQKMKSDIELGLAVSPHINYQSCLVMCERIERMQNERPQLPTDEEFEKELFPLTSILPLTRLVHDA